MTDLSKVTDYELMKELYFRVKGDVNMLTKASTNIFYVIERQISYSLEDEIFGFQIEHSEKGETNE
jgi:hypothetical protein